MWIHFQTLTQWPGSGQAEHTCLHASFMQVYMDFKCDGELRQQITLRCSIGLHTKSVAVSKLTGWERI